MGDQPAKSDKSLKKDDRKQFIFLMKDAKLICRTQCLNPPKNLPHYLNLDIVRRCQLHINHDLPHCNLFLAAENSRDRNEWGRFLSFLHKKGSVGIAKFENYRFYLLPPAEATDFGHVRVAYGKEKASNKYGGQKHCESVVGTTEACGNSSTMSSSRDVDELIAGHEDGPLVKNYVRADPSYLQTLGQAHSGWIFGAIAELVDNSRDAKASRLDISVEIIYSKRAGREIPMLSIIDDGCGMTHQEVVRMTCFGHKQPDAVDLDRIGRFGVGFKTGAMRLGRDALVLTQTSDSRSIAFLLQSLNEGKDNLEIPIVSYRKTGQSMDVDTDIQSESLAKMNLKAIKKFSQFDKYLIGEKSGLFCGKRTGTQIYIWNLDEWGSDYCLEWTNGVSGGSSFHQGDILIRSRRVRSRPGQMSRKVPLDYSLRSYLEVIFLVPRMRIYVQGSLVKSRPLAKSLNKTHESSGNLCGKCVHLTLGRCQLEWEQGNGGMFLYWHGRLIEAYKRVGGMTHSGHVGRGVIGVIDVTNLMDDANGRVWVHNNKQGFLDCEPYSILEEWLGKKADKYWDQNYDSVQLEKGSLLYKPDNEWVQCDKCRKWRMLSSGFDSKNLPLEWFCYMEPFAQSCDTPEQKVESGVITVSTKRSGYDVCDVEDDATVTSEGNSNGDSDQTEKDAEPCLKRIRKGLPRACKKKRRGGNSFIL